jgi:putative transposase
MEKEYTPKEIAEMVGVTRQAIQKRVKTESWPSHKRQARGGGKAFYLSDLPDDVQHKILAEVARDVVAQVPAVRSSAAPAIVEIPTDAAIPDEAHQSGLDRYRIVHEWRSSVARSSTTKGRATEAFLLAYHSGQLMPKVHARMGRISQPTLYKWDKTLRDNGDDYRTLCDKRGAWLKGGRKGNGQIGEAAEAVFLTAWLNPNRPGLSLAYEATKAILEKRGIEVASYASFRRFAKRYDAHHHDLVVLLREGEKALKDKVGPYATRNGNILAVGDCIFADGHDLNFQVIHPVTGRACRMCLLVWFDWRSRMPVGWEIMPSESTFCISAALRMACQTLGKYPKVAYIDNGRAFTSKYFMEHNEELDELSGLYARLGIAVRRSKPYEARTKIVERFFRTFDEQCQRLLPSYCGHNIDSKPAWMARNEKWHQDRHADWVPNVREAAEIFRLYAGWYAHRECRPLGKGVTPLQLLEAGRGPGIDSEELDQAFMHTKVVHPKRCRFTLAGVEYESDVLYRLNQKIKIRYHWADLSSVQMFTMDNHSLGDAKPVAAIHPLAKEFGGELDMLKVQEANRLQARLKRETLRQVEAMGLGRDSEAIQQLPWMTGQKEPLQLEDAVDERGQSRMGTDVVVDEEISAELVARQEAITAELDAEQPGYDRPAFFMTELERYEHLFKVSEMEGIDLIEEDRAWKAYYETSREYAEVAAPRYNQLRQTLEMLRESECAAL